MPDFPRFILLLAVISLAACASQGPAASRAPMLHNIAIGQIQGPGAEELTRALKAQASGAAQATLGGTISFREAVSEERETVPVTVAAGKPESVYKPDPFTKRVWLTEETPTATEFQTFDLQRVAGEMLFNWQITGKDGRVIDSGVSKADLNRTFGGFMAAQKVAPGPQNSDRLLSEARRALAEEMTRLLALSLGRQPSPDEIETAPDDWSRRAKNAASRGDWEEAKNIWLEALDLNPNFAPAHYNLGLYYERAGEPERALSSYQRAFVADGSPRHRAALTRITEAAGRP